MNDPHSLEAERAVLGSVLVSPAALDEIAWQVEASDFYLPVHRIIWEAYLRIRGTSRPIDLVTVGDALGKDLGRLEGREAYLVQLANGVPTALTAPHYAQIVRDLADRRRLIAVAAEAAVHARDLERPTDEVLSWAQREVYRATTGGRAPAAMDLGRVLESAVSTIERKETAAGFYGFPTGLAKLDEQLGQLQPENLVIVAARPGGGKTALALNICWRGAAQAGLPSLVFNMEMSPVELCERLIAADTGIPVRQLHAVTPGSPLGHDAWKRVHQAHQRLGRLPIALRTGRLVLGQLEAEARRWRALHKGPGLIVVDYIQRLKLGARYRRGMKESDVISEVSGALKDLATDLGIPVLGVSQLNRESEKERRRPGLQDLKGSGALEQDADTVVMPYRNTADKRIKDEAGRRGLEPEQVAELRLPKSRHGPPGWTFAKWDGPTNVFSDLVAA